MIPYDSTGCVPALRISKVERWGGDGVRLKIYALNSHSKAQAGLGFWRILLVRMCWIISNGPKLK